MKVTETIYNKDGKAVGCRGICGGGQEPQTLKKLKVGDCIYNHGDMANASHFGTISRVIIDKWGTHYEIAPDKDLDTGDAPAEEQRKPYTISAAQISPSYLGHGGTRIVTAEAYQSWLARQASDPQDEKADCCEHCGAEVAHKMVGDECYRKCPNGCAIGQ